MRKKYSSKNDPAESLYQEAQNDAKKSVRYRTGPAQIEVIKKYSGAAKLFEEKGDMYRAKEALEGAAEYLSGSRWSRAADPKLRKRITNQLDDIYRKLPTEGRGKLQRRLFVFAFLAIASFIVALFFISFDLTGYVVMGQPRSNLSFLAAGLFVFGLSFVFLYFKNKK